MRDILKNKQKHIDQHETDKKNYASQRKFREASMCQGQMKKLENEIESEVRMANKL